MADKKMAVKAPCTTEFDLFPGLEFNLGDLRGVQADSDGPFAHFLQRLMQHRKALLVSTTLGSPCQKDMPFFHQAQGQYQICEEVETLRQQIDEAVQELIEMEAQDQEGE